MLERNHTLPDSGATAIRRDPSIPDPAVSDAPGAIATNSKRPAKRSHGRRIALTVSRKFITDLMWISASVPRICVERRASIGQVVRAREAQADTPSWSAIFSKALAIVAEEYPELKRAYVKLPRPHLYEYAESTVSVGIDRDFFGQPGVFPARIRHPAAISLGQMSEMIRHAATCSLEEMKFFRQVVWLERRSWPIRRFFWWLAANWARQRKHYFGTIAVTAVASLGAESAVVISPYTTLLTYGIIDPQGDLVTRIFVDHRVYDGALAARVLVRLEQVLNGEILDELRQSAA